VEAICLEIKSLQASNEAVLKEDKGLRFSFKASASANQASNEAIASALVSLLLAIYFLQQLISHRMPSSLLFRPVAPVSQISWPLPVSLLQSRALKSFFLPGLPHEQPRGFLRLPAMSLLGVLSLKFLRKLLVVLLCLLVSLVLGVLSEHLLRDPYGFPTSYVYRAVCKSV
jgi:hypothetical protein